MERFVKGDVVIMPFPFSNLRATKRRPAVVVADPQGDDYIVAQITSVSRRDDSAISLVAKEFTSGRLPRDSMIRPNKLFTADSSLIVYKAGSIQSTKMSVVQASLVRIFTS